MNNFSRQDTWVSGDVRVLRMRPVVPQPVAPTAPKIFNKIVEVELHYSPAEYWVTQGHKQDCWCTACRYRPLGGGNALQQVESAEMEVDLLTESGEQFEIDILRYRRELMSRLRWKRLTTKRVALLQGVMAQCWVGQDLDLILQAGINILLGEMSLK